MIVSEMEDFKDCQVLPTLAADFLFFFLSFPKIKFNISQPHLEWQIKIYEKFSEINITMPTVSVHEGHYNL